MEELLLMEYLRNKGINMDVHEFFDKYKNFMSKESQHTHNDESHTHDETGKEEIESESNDLSKFISRPVSKSNIIDVKNMGNEHFNESYARYLISTMYHYENGRKCIGEKFDINKAKEVLSRYRGILPQTITCADVYVAINSQYHDYYSLFNIWFNGEADQKIIESAIVYWFKDEDYKEGSKLWNYFKKF